jgi:hypothetical protein
MRNNRKANLPKQWDRNLLRVKGSDRGDAKPDASGCPARIKSRGLYQSGVMHCYASQKVTKPAKNQTGNEAVYKRIEGSLDQVAERAASMVTRIPRGHHLKKGVTVFRAK